MALRINLRSTLTCGILLLAVACGDENASDSHDEASASDLDVAMSALENPIISCQIKAGECVQKAADITALQACQSGVGDCLKAAADKVQKVADGVGTCREQERKCARTGGAQGNSCVEGFRTCVQALVPDSDSDGGAPSLPTLPDAGVPSFPGWGDAGLPGLPTRDAGLPGFPALDAGRPSLPGFPARDDAGRPGLPSFPSFGDGGLPAFPGGGGLGNLPKLPGDECREGLRTCASQPSAKLIQCAADARKCLNAAVVPSFMFP